MGKNIVVCHCGGEIINSERFKLIEEFLREKSVDIVKLSDLCGLSALNDQRLNTVFQPENEYLIVGCYPRAMNLLLEKNNINISHLPVSYANFVEQSNEQILQEISTFCQKNDQPATITEIKTDSEWPAWYPIIDYSRCTSCGQCADFCLFGVYTKTSENVTVENPQGCKNNCPACARICPHTAIIFPKYKHGGAIGGSEVIDEIAEQKRQAQDIDDILGSDVYTALEQRKVKRQSIIRNEAMLKANEERDNALKESGIR